jgi:hypothetical protein
MHNMSYKYQTVAGNKSGQMARATEKCDIMMQNLSDQNYGIIEGYHET